MLLCFRCDEIRDSGSAICLECGEQLQPANKERLRAFVAARARKVVKEQVNAWERTQLLPADIASTLRHELHEEERRVQEEAARREAERAQRREQKRLDKLRRQQEERAAAEAAAKEEERRQLQERRAEAQRRRDEAQATPEPEVAEAAELDSALPVAGAALALSELDPPEAPAQRSEAVALLYENIGWLIGAVFVLAGSVYGVREAWNAFGEVGRFASVGGAFLGYQAAFVGLGKLLASRSRRAGMVLSALGVSLLPITAVAFMHLLSADLALGGGAAAVFLLTAAITLSSTAARFSISSRVGFWLAGLPALGCMLPLGLIESAATLRFVLPLLALLPIAAFAAAPALLLRHPDDEAPRDAGPLQRPSLAPVVFAVCFAIAANILALTSVASDDSNELLNWRVGGVTQGVWLALWVASFAAALGWVAATLAPVWPRLSSVGLVLVTALGSVAALATGLLLLDPTQLATPTTAWLGVLVAAMALVVAFRAGTRIAKLWHTAVPLMALTAALAARALSPEQPVSSPLVAALSLAGVAVALPWLWPDPRRVGLRVALNAWLAVCVGAALAVAPAEAPPEARVLLLAVFAALHIAGAREHTSWHYTAATFGGVVLLAMLPTAEGRTFGAAALAGLYVLGARLPAIVRPAALAQTGLVWLAIAVALGLDAGAAPQLLQPSPLSERTLVALGSALLLVLHSVSFRARPTAVFGLLIAFVATALVAGSNAPGQLALVAGAFALSVLAIAAALALLPRREGEANEPLIHFIGVAPNPTGPGLLTTFVDAAAIIAVPLGALATLGGLLWLGGDRSEVDRGFAVQGGVLAIATGLVLFLSRASVFVRLRGTNAVLWACGAVIAVTAVVNRIGRPLPPHVVARNLTVIAVLLWLVAITLQRYGRALGKWLDNEREGADYHRLPHTGVAALTALLVLDAALLWRADLLFAAAVTPPLFLLGPALTLALLGRSLFVVWLPLVGVLTLIGGVFLAGVQQSVLGVPLVQQGPGLWLPEGVAVDGALPWSAWEHYLPFGLSPRDFIARGVDAMAALALAFAVSITPPAGALRVRVGRFFYRSRDDVAAMHSRAAAWLGVGAVLGLGLVTSSLRAALLLLVACAVGAFAQRRFAAWVPLVIAYALHAHAQAQAAVPAWTGVAIAAVAFAAALALWLLVTPERARGVLPPVASAEVVTLGGLAVLYALVIGGAPQPLREAAGLAEALFSQVAERVLMTPLLPAATLLVCASLLLLALAAHRAGAPMAPSVWPIAAASALVPSLGAVSLFADARNPWRGPVWSPLVSAVESALAVVPLLGLCLASAAFAAHLGARVFSPFNQPFKRVFPITRGARVSRDLLAAAAAIALMALAGALAVPRANAALPSQLLLFALLGLGLLITLSAHVAFRERSPLHLYAAQSGVTACYLFLRLTALQGLRPEHDALFSLLLAFVLLGVTVLARRAKVPLLATTTRRFAAALPVVMAFVLPWQPSTDMAAFIAGGGLFYAMLGWFEGSRLFGAFSAGFVNLALFVIALSEGSVGAHIYCAPLGLFVIALGHLFGGSLEHGARVSVRVIGSCLVYAPAAWQIVTRTGNADEPLYAFGFAGACVVGIALGMLLHIRAYLALGVGFLLLDLVAGLVRIGQQSQRFGFFVLSGAGLFILLFMVVFTLKRAELTRLWRRARGAFRAWD